MSARVIDWITRDSIGWRTAPTYGIDSNTRRIEVLINRIARRLAQSEMPFGDWKPDAGDLAWPSNRGRQETSPLAPDYRRRARRTRERTVNSRNLLADRTSRILCPSLNS